MSRPTIENFDISFIKRTSRNLKKYRGKYEFTMLINSLLGLLVVPNEQADRKGFEIGFLKNKLTNYPKLEAIFTKPTEKLDRDGVEMEQEKFLWLSGTNVPRPIGEISLGEFLTRMRHGIAHFGIVPVAAPERKKEWCGIILRNCREDGTLNFEICLMEEEIRCLAAVISYEFRKAVILKKRWPD
jgi:hypothetical protein